MISESSTTNSSEMPDAAPEEFICPLTLNVMKDPVLSKYGHNFERKAIVEWINTKNAFVCPMTRQELYPSMLVPNFNMKKKIQQWRIDQGQDVSEVGDDSESTESETETELEFARISANVAPVNLINDRCIFGNIREEDLEGLPFNEAVLKVREAICQYSDDVIVMAVRQLARAKAEERRLLQASASRKKQGGIFKRFGRKSNC